MTYRILIDRQAERDLRRLSGPVWRRICDRIRSFAEEPRPHGCLKLTGTNDLWRVRVRDYRIIYSIDDHDQVVKIEYVRHRRDAYR